MRDVYNSLKHLDYFIDNEYLVLYASLVERNTRTVKRSIMTHKHHIIPKSWFKLTNTNVNNDLNNLVNLSYRNHVLAHYYLCLCTEGPFQFANELALFCLLGRKKLTSVDKALFMSLPLYNNIYESYKLKRQNGYYLYSDKEE